MAQPPPAPPASAAAASSASSQAGGAIKPEAAEMPGHEDNPGDDMSDDDIADLASAIDWEEIKAAKGQSASSQGQAARESLKAARQKVREVLGKKTKAKRS